MKKHKRNWKSLIAENLNQDFYLRIKSNSVKYIENWKTPEAKINNLNNFVLPLFLTFF